MENISRRKLLSGLAAVAGMSALAACGAPAASPTAAPAAPAAQAPAAAPTATTAAGQTPAAGAPTATPAAAAAAAKPTEAAKPTVAAKPAAQGQQVTLNFQHFFTGVLWDNAFKGLTEDFTKQTGIKFTGSAVPYAEMMPKLTTLVAGGQPPDGTSLDNEVIKSCIYRKLVKELDSYISSDKTVAISDLYKARLDSYADKGKQYALPIDMGTGAIYYNRDAFDQAGLKYPDPKWTYQDILTTAQKLTLDQAGKKPGDNGFDKNNVKQWGFRFRPEPYRLYNLCSGFNGAQFFDQAVTKTRFNEPEMIEALTWFGDLRSKHFVTPSSAQDLSMRPANNSAIQPFTSGGYAMEHTWIGLVAYMHQDGIKVKNWDVINLPETATAAQECGGQGFVVVNGAKQPDAAWAFIKYSVGDDMQKFLGTNGVWFPARKSLAKFGIPKDGKPEGFMNAFYDQVDRHGVAPWWNVPGYDLWQQTITNELDLFWLGTRDAKATVAAIQQKLDPLVANWEKAIQ